VKIKSSPVATAAMRKEYRVLDPIFFQSLFPDWNREIRQLIDAT
jgi:hypothetical protein